MMKRCVLLSVLLAALPASAKNVDLSTLPPRDTVQLTIYNAEDLTLVRETRRLTFRKGINPLQFSWANTLIDPTSVQIRFPKNAADLDVLDTTYPHDKPQMLYWNVQSEIDGEALVEVKYFTSGLSWSADYTCIANPDETEMRIESFVRVYNNSGEAYENAEVRLVVGEINLVEAIADLARRGLIAEDGDDEVSLSVTNGAWRAQPQHQVLYDYAFSAGAAFGGYGGGGYGGSLGMDRPKEVVKESLGEYFIYTIEGTETIPNGWSKQLRSFEADEVPIDIEYRYRPREYGDQLVRMYLTTNDEESKLGGTPLPDGTVRVYRDNGRDGLSYLSQQQIKYVPIGDKIELNLGADPQVIHERVMLENWRDNFWFRRLGMDIYRSLDGRHVLEITDQVVGWEDHHRYVERIRNFRDASIDVEIRRVFDGHVFFISQLEPRLHDFETVEINATLSPGRTDLPYHVRILQGYLAKQDNVTLERGE